MPPDAATPTDALSLLLISNFPLVCRLCAAQLGDASLGPVIAQAIMRRSLRIADRWRDSADARRWFARHALLECRDILSKSPARPAPARDPLNPQPDAAGPGYALFIQSLRRLPFQQREAVILHDLEGFDPRETALAMDCSIEAAVNHLLAGNRALAETLGAEIDSCRHNVRVAYGMLTPPPAEISLAMQRVLKRKQRWKRWIVFAIAIVIVLAASIWMVERFFMR